MGLTRRFYAYEPGLFTISRILRTGDYNTLEQKHYVKDEKGNERKNYYMGYELQLVEGVEDGPEYDATKYGWIYIKEVHIRV